jgi:hypothetical protein
MSEEPDVTAPGPDAPDDTESEGAGAPSPATGLLAGVLPSWVRRRPVISAITAGVLVAALIAGYVLAAAPLSPPGPRYASVPGQPSALIGAAELAKYMPGATGSPQSIGAGNSVKTATCKWSARSGGEDRTLRAQAYVYRTPSPVGVARQVYRSSLSAMECHCQGVAVSARPVTGLGDQAAEMFIAPRPDANFVAAPNAVYPGTSLLVWSSNAVISLSLNTTATSTGAFLSSPPDPAQLAGLVSMARDLLNVLAHPASVPRSAVAPVVPEPRYVGRRDPCRLISTATLARYVPGYVLSPQPDSSSPGSAQLSQCGWNAGGISITLTLTLSSGAAGALRAFDSGAGSIGVRVSGARWLPDLGEEATASFTIQPAGSPDVAEVFVWSGNAELDYTYTSDGSRRSQLDRSAPLKGVLAMARDGLAALARPALSSFPRGPNYASSQRACTLIRASTLARYGVAGTGTTYPGGPQVSTCFWNSDSLSIEVSIAIDSGPDNAQGAFQFDVQDARTNQGDVTFRAATPVRGVGEQAEAIFQTVIGSPSVDLYVRSGNAVAEIRTDSLDSPLGRAGLLAADIAMARDALGRLRRS